MLRAESITLTLTDRHCRAIACAALTVDIATRRATMHKLAALEAQRRLDDVIMRTIGEP